MGHISVKEAQELAADTSLDNSWQGLWLFHQHHGSAADNGEAKPLKPHTRLERLDKVSELMANHDGAFQ